MRLAGIDAERRLDRVAINDAHDTSQAPLVAKRKLLDLCGVCEHLAFIDVAFDFEHRLCQCYCYDSVAQNRCKLSCLSYGQTTRTALKHQSMVESKTMPSVGCGKFVSRRGNWKRSSKHCRCLPPGEALRRERRANLNANRRYREVCNPEPLRLIGCACGDPTPRSERRRRERGLRTAQRPPIPISWVTLPQACQFADVLYYAWRHRFFVGSGDVQAQLARGYRYSVPRCGSERCNGGSANGAGGGFSNSVTLEAPQGEICYRTQACVADIIAALPGACRASSRVEQAHIQCSIANWWLGPTLATEVLASLDPQQVADVPLDRRCARSGPTQ